MSDSFQFEAELWLYSGKAAWTFLTLPTDVADEVLDVAPPAAGFGSVTVEVRIGGTRWSTSLFPDTKSGSFVLPVKRSVREAESIDIGDTVHAIISLVASR